MSELCSENEPVEIIPGTPKDVGKLRKDLISTVRAGAATGATPYTGDLSLGTNPMQTQGATMISRLMGGGAYKPMVPGGPIPQTPAPIYDGDYVPPDPQNPVPRKPPVRPPGPKDPLPGEPDLLPVGPKGPGGNVTPEMLMMAMAQKKKRQFGI